MLELDIKIDLHLDTVEVDSKRYYVTPIGNLPSVTTVLSRAKDASGSLDKWKKSVGPERAEMIRDNAATFGTAIHNRAEAYILDKKPEELDFFQQDRWDQLKEVIDTDFGKIYACETCLYSDLLRIAGRTDVIGQFRGINSLIDFKNSNKPKQLKYISDYWLQTTAYSLMYWERLKDPETVPKQLVILNTTPHEGVQVFIQPVKPWIQPLKKLVSEYV
jgi:hypothetical protein